MATEVRVQEDWWVKKCVSAVGDHGVKVWRARIHIVVTCKCGRGLVSGWNGRRLCCYSGWEVWVLGKEQGWANLISEATTEGCRGVKADKRWARVAGNWACGA